MSTTTIVKASELGHVLSRIFELRNPDARAAHEEALAEYERKRGKRKEAMAKPPGGDLFAGQVRGFFVLEDGIPVFTPRPSLNRPRGYVYRGYDRSFGITDHARSGGLLADARFNREIRPTRVDEYAAEMQAGNWRDLLSDPITITEDGHVLNGQHRLAAAEKVDWKKAGNDPSFLVVWGVDPQEALHADGSRRTARDEKTIATKLVNAA